MDDLEFVQRCVKGNRLAWDEFLRRYSRLIYSYIYKVLNTKDYTFAGQHIEDIFQEIFAHLIKDNFRKLKSYKGRNGCSLASWLRQVTINLTIDYLRKIRPAVSLDAEIDADFTLQDILADDAPEITDKLHQTEILKDLKECIEKLERNDKFFLRLLLRQDFKTDALRDFFKVSRPVIDMRKVRLLERLKRCFQDKGIFLR